MSDPLYVLPHRDGGVNVVVDAKTAKGEPIIVGVCDGRIRTITPRHDLDTRPGIESLNADIAQAVERGDKIYTKNGEALDNLLRQTGNPPHPSPKRPSHRGPAANILSRDDIIKRQGRIFYQTAAPPFFSAVERAVEGIKQDKGGGPQFLAMITKTPGVKPEQLARIGLDEFLRGKKAVTKQEVIDFVRANDVRIVDVTKGGVSRQQACPSEPF